MQGAQPLIYRYELSATATHRCIYGKNFHCFLDAKLFPTTEQCIEFGVSDLPGVSNISNSHIACY
jgi:hypothetical protein